MSKIERLRDLGVRRLEHVFTPSGLPLVEKEPGNRGTTSILVRGSAGAGKTTLAVALANAIARKYDGVVLYLTTEFSPAEIQVKAEFLGLEAGTVRPWGDAEHSTGTIFVETLAHLEQQRLDENGPGVAADGELAAIEALHRLLHRDGSTSRPPVRAVVLDALALSDSGGHQPGLREPLLAMIQGLEHEGISTIIVEEAAPGSPAWVTFVVDVVLELSFGPDPETQELRRSLVCGKSRYALSVAGPHVYSLDNGVPSLWPSSLRVLAGTDEFRLEPLRVAIPASQRDRWTSLFSGLIVSQFDKSGLWALNAIRAVPGAHSYQLDCGSASTISLPEGRLGTVISDTEGPYALGWECLERAHRDRRNVLVIQSLEVLLQRPSQVIPLTHVIDALARAGLLVVVHGRSDLLMPVAAAAQVEWNGRARVTRRAPLRFASATRWVLAPDILKGISDETSAELTWLSNELPQCDSMEKVTEVAERLDQHHQERGVQGDWVGRAERTLLGGRVELNPSRAHPAILQAKVALLEDDDWAAARIALDGFQSDVPDREIPLLWTCVCASVALNPAAIDVLKGAVGDAPWVLNSLLRALAQLDRITEVGEVVLQAVERYRIDGWLVERLVGEAYLHGNADASQRGYNHLRSLETDPRVPLIHRAEILHNLGVAESRMNRTAEAIDHHDAALRLNPYLEVARLELSRLRTQTSSDSH